MSTDQNSKSSYLHMNELRENSILLNGFLFVFLPLLIVGVLSMFFPMVYVLLPVQESEFCVCSYWEM